MIFRFVMKRTKFFIFCILIFVAQLSPGLSIAVILGDTVSLDCYDPILASEDVDFYVNLQFINSVQANQIVVFKPDNSHHTWVDKSYKTRLKFLNSGQVRLSFIGMPDEGTFVCSSKGFLVDPTDAKTVRSTVITVYVSPYVQIKMISNPMVVGSRSTDAVECLARDGKPPARVKWSSRFSDFSQFPSNETTVSLTTVSSMLKVIPTKSLNKQEFLCEVTHPAFDVKNVTVVTLNVTYPPEVPKILVNKEQQQLTCISDGNPPPIYEWKMPPGASSSKELGQTVKIIKAYDPSRQNDTYVCTASNSVGNSLSSNITTYQAMQLTINESNIGLIVGIAVGVVALIAILTATYCCLFKKARRKDELKYLESKKFVHHSRNTYPRPYIQHENDMLHKQKPSAPIHPPPNDIDDFGVRYSDSGSSYSGEHDVDLTAPVLPNDNDSLHSGSKVGITSKASMNFRKQRHGPGSYQGSYGGKGDGLMQPQDDAESTLSSGHQSSKYDLPPTENEADFSSEPRKNLLENQQRYLNVDRSARKSSLARSSPYEDEKAVYAQVNKQRQFQNV